MSKKDEALAKFVEVVEKLSPEEFEEKYVKEDMMIYKLMIRTNGVWKGNLKVTADDRIISDHHEENSDIEMITKIDGTKKIHFHMDQVNSDDFGIDIEIKPPIMEDMKPYDIVDNILKLLDGKNMKAIEMILYGVQSHCNANYALNYKPKKEKQEDGTSDMF